MCIFSDRDTEFMEDTGIMAMHAEHAAQEPMNRRREIFLKWGDMIAGLLTGDGFSGYLPIQVKKHV
jgi:hypothetical protein